MSWLRKIARWLFKGRITRPESDIEVYKVNLLKDPEDPRDQEYAVKVTPLAAASLPAKAIVSGLFTVKNQGTLSSCASHAFATAVENVCSKNDKSTDDIPLSELFHYYVVRQKDYMDSFPEDSGQYLRQGAKVLYDYGICPEKLWVYDTSKLNVKPGFMAYGWAGLWRIKAYNRCWSLDGMQLAISQDKPVVFGVTVTGDCFKTPIDGELRYAQNIIGGHALCAVAYDDTRVNADGTTGAFRFINSWNNTWGDQGYGWISYSNCRKHFLDAWTVTLR